MKKIRNWIVRFLTGFDQPALTKARKILSDLTLADQLNPFSGPSVNSGLNDTYLFDFKNWASEYNGQGVGILNAGVAAENAGRHAIGGGISPFVTVESGPEKIKIKPIDVLNKLETIPVPFDLLGLDDKIMILKTKEDLIVQHYAKREITALIERLENRKKYHEHKPFFESFQNTTDEKIDGLLKKYALVMKASDIFVPEFPNQAIEIMKQYEETVKLICAKKPVFYVIAEAVDFVKKYERRDPILLVQSPFGFYWQILGAWDKEMLLLSEL